MSNVVKITGIREIQKALEKLPKELQRTTEMVALRAGAKPILNAARTNAKSSEVTGQLIKSLGINVRKGKSGKTRGIYTARIGARRGFRIMKGIRTSGKSQGKRLIHRQGFFPQSRCVAWKQDRSHRLWSRPSKRIAPREKSQGAFRLTLFRCHR